MATTTTNIGLTKPAASENYDVDVWNTNMDLIDSACDFYRHSWTPQLYDLNTYVRELPTENVYVGYFKIGRIVFAYYSGTCDLSGVSTMLQIRNLPMNVVLGGSAYFAALNQNGTTVSGLNLVRSVIVQGGTSYLYIRPNITSAEFSSASSTGFSFMIIGVSSS